MGKLPTQFHCLHPKRVAVKIQWPKQSATWLHCLICLVWILWKVYVDVKFVSLIVWLHLPPQSLNCWADATTVVERTEDWPWVKMEFLYCADAAVARQLSMPGLSSAGAGHRASIVHVQLYSLLAVAYWNGRIEFKEKCSRCFWPILELYAFYNHTVWWMLEFFLLCRS